MTTFTREDFEHAARSIGWRLVAFDGVTPVVQVHDGARAFGWRPHADDGDALRLAVKIGLGILTKVNNAAHVAERCLGVCDIHQVNYGAAGDEFAATRHAIFRAAIAIGRAMPAPEVRPTEAPGPSSTGETSSDHQLETLKTGRWRLALTGGQTYPVTVRGVEAVKPPEKPSGIGDIEVRIPTTPRKP